MRGIGGKLTTGLGDLKSKISNALKKGGKKQITVDVNDEATNKVKQITVDLEEENDNSDKLAQKLIISSFEKHPPITSGLTTNDNLWSILPLVQAQINGIKAAHEYKISLSSKDKSKKFQPANNIINITFQKRDNKNVSFSHKLTVNIKKAQTNINLSRIPSTINAINLFTTKNTWNDVLNYIKRGMGNISSSKDYEIILKDKKARNNLKETDSNFTITIIQKKGNTKVDKSIKIGNIKTKIQNDKKNLSSRVSGLLNKLDSKNTKPSTSTKKDIRSKNNNHKGSGSTSSTSKSSSNKKHTSSTSKRNNRKR